MISKSEKFFRLKEGKLIKNKILVTFILIALRLFIAGVYIFSGAEKLLQPYQNFAYVIQSYDLLRNTMFENVVALSFPWLECFTGLFLLLGLWTRFALIGIATFSVIFIVVVGQAIVRHLPMGECGCFGDSIGMPLQATLTLDLFILISIFVLMRYEIVQRFTLDRFFQNNK